MMDQISGRTSRKDASQNRVFRTCLGESNDIKTVSNEDEREVADVGGRGIGGQVAWYKPSAKEKGASEKSHIPFRRWCVFCVMGKSKNASHRSSENEDKHQVPTISRNYAVSKSK